MIRLRSFLAMWSALFCLSVYGVYQAEYKPATVDLGHVTGRVVKLFGIGMSKPKDRYLWEDLSMDSPIIDGTTISTGANSKLQIVTLDGGIIELGADSQIVFESESKKKAMCLSSS